MINKFEKAHRIPTSFDKNQKGKDIEVLEYSQVVQYKVEENAW
jgi:hypothetical protein